MTTEDQLSDQAVRHAIWTEVFQIVTRFFPDVPVGVSNLCREVDGSWNASIYMVSNGVRETYVLGMLFSDPRNAELDHIESKEIWAVTPIGREFGSPDYERYEALDTTMRRFRAGSSKQSVQQASKLARKYKKDAGHVQHALRQMGHDVTLTVAAHVWMAYSEYMRAVWMSGAESIDSARDTLWRFFGDIDGLADGVFT